MQLLPPQTLRCISIRLVASPFLSAVPHLRTHGNELMTSTGNTSASRHSSPRAAYVTNRGTMLHGAVEDCLSDGSLDPWKGKIQLLFTSPPFPLNRKKEYGNLTGDAYVSWLSELAPQFASLLTSTGSIVVEIGNAWEPGKPTMSLLATKALLGFLESGELHLCQQFIAHNPAKLPGPASWVTVERIRVKDSFTHVWWMAKTERPKSDNRRVLTPYSESMKRLLKTGRYNSGKRPSGHDVNPESFAKDHGGAIPSNVLSFTNTRARDPYQDYCRRHNFTLHPARMPNELAEFFIKFLTDPDDIVFDPFAGSNVTGSVAENLDRQWISVEPMHEYIRGSRGRFRNIIQ